MQIIDFIKKQYRFILPMFHFMLSFLYERTIILFHFDQDIIPSIPRNTWISTELERTVAYILSKAIALLLIWCLWKVLFFVIDHFRESKYVKCWLVFFGVGLILGICIFPTSFVRSTDNYITYSYAIRLLPEYWHNAYSGYVYCAMMMVFPHPIAISLLQWTLFAIAIGYMVYRMNQSPVIKGKGKWFLFLITLIPGMYVLLTDAYRTEQYAIAGILYTELVIMDIVDCKKRSPKELFAILVYAAFLSTWRTEGILFASIAFFALVVCTYRFRWKKAALWLAGFVVALFIVSFPQKIGDIKYYYKDYSIVNSFSVLQNILNAPDANLSYEGAEEDFAAIEAITPIDAIQLWGLEGYRRVNVMLGRTDINQSLAEPEVADAFLKAYYRMVFHNPKILIKTKLSYLTTIFKITEGPYDLPAPFEDEGKYPKWTYSAWEIGKEDFLSAKGIEKWANNYPRQLVLKTTFQVRDAFDGVRAYLWLDMILYFGIPLVEIWMVIRELFLWIRKKEGYPGLGVLAFGFLALFGGIVLAMPAGLKVYFDGYYYMSFFLTGIYCILFCRQVSSRIRRNRSEKAR